MATSILSKRWLPVSTLVPIIDLRDSPFCKTDSNLRLRFRQFVTRVLIFNKMASLHKFCLKFNLVDHPSYVKTWFWDAVSRDAKELDITIHGTQSFHFLKLPFAIHWDWRTKMARRNFRPHRSFVSLVRLELSVGYGGWNMLSLFLEISNNLKVLVLAKNDNCGGFGFECRWKPPKYVPECLLSSLERVDFIGFEDVAYQLGMVKYILENARVLKTMNICSDGDLPLDSKLVMLKNLSMFPRGSKACQLQFS